MKFLKILFTLIIFISLIGCVQTTALLGPGVTIAATGNVMQAGLQYGANSAIKKETGKDTFEHLKDAVDNKNKNKKLKFKFTTIIQNVKKKLSTN
jgi:hypothetical protein